MTSLDASMMNAADIMRHARISESAARDADALGYPNMAAGLRREAAAITDFAARIAIESANHERTTRS